MSRIAKTDALGILSEGHREVDALVGRLSPADAVAAGLGGGTWSPKDLLGHLTSWEEYALAAVGAWADGVTAPIDQALRAKGLTAVNREAVEMRSERPLARVRAEFDDVHRELIRVLGALADETWDAPPTRRARRPLGEKVGAILGGPGGWYRHAAAHLPDLRAFVAERSAR
jgi:hypothetical protein